MDSAPTPSDPCPHHLRRRRRAAIRHQLFTRPAARIRRLRADAPPPRFTMTADTVALARLPAPIAPFTIAHLSDPHVGELLTPAHLPRIVESINAMGADLIAVTGDFIDFSNAYLPAVVEAMAALRAPLGSYFVLGNHDYLDNADEVKRRFADAGLNLLLNEAATIEHAGCRISIGGIDWSHDPRRLEHDVHAAVRAMEPQTADLSILLAHHPHAFDTARLLGVDLTLSGHTHGGQLLLSKKLGKKGSIGLGNLAFKYTRGLYQHDGRHLFVSSGLGSWFPLRIRCPAEITRLQLTTT